jgi:hypothetical protein
VLARSKSLFALPSYQADKLSRYYTAVRLNTNLNPDLELLQLLAELGEGSFILPDLYTAARILYIAVILKTGLRAAAAEDVYYLTAYVAVMFQDSTHLQE